ncbi:hypothetical protein ACRCOK_10365, partial [Streptococcus uberis]
MQLRFTHITNHLRALGVTYAESSQTTKILRCLTPEWEAKRTAIMEVRGESMKSLTALFGNLQNYESKIKEMRQEDESKKRRTLSLKASSSRKPEAESDEEEEI